MSAETSLPNGPAIAKKPLRARGLGNLNPVMTKDLRGRMRGWRTTILLSIYLFIISAVALLFYTISKETRSFSNPLDSNVGQSLFYGVVVFQTVLVALIAPAFTAGIITGEREKQTYELLMTTLLKPVSIILGKLGAALAWLLLLVLMVVPLEALAFVFGGVAPEEIVLATIVLLFTAVLYGVIGLFWSTIARSTVASTVLSYGTVLFLTLGMPAIWGAMALVVAAGSSGNQPAWASAPWLIYLSGIWLSTNPFIAMGLSQSYLSQNKPIFFFFDTLGSSPDMLIVQPWLVFCVLATAISAVLILISIRFLPPTHRRSARSLTAAPVPASAIVGQPPTTATENELLISPMAEQTLSQREAEDITGEVRLGNEQKGPEA